MNVKTAATSLALLGALGGGAAAANAATSTHPTTPTTSTSAQAQAPTSANPLKADLDKLVKDGTITSAQETKILAGLKAERPGAPNGNFHPGGSGPRGAGMGHRGGPRHSEKALASALKLSESQLRADFAKGETLAQIAKAQNVSQADVTKALQGDADKRVSDMVTKMWNTKLGQHAGSGARQGGSPSGTSSSTPSSTGTSSATA